MNLLIINQEEGGGVTGGSGIRERGLGGCGEDAGSIWSRRRSGELRCCRTRWGKTKVMFGIAWNEKVVA